MYCISYLLKFNKGFNRSFFEKKDQDETGNGIFFINVVDKIIISNALESITPLKLRNNDKDLLVNAFNKNQQFDYISFFNILTIISKDKPFECTISIFGLCYAMLLAITKTYEDLPSELDHEISNKLSIEKEEINYSKIVSKLSLLPKDMMITTHDTIWIYNSLLADKTFSEIIAEYIILNPNEKIQRILFNWTSLFEKREELGSSIHSKKHHDVITKLYRGTPRMKDNTKYYSKIKSLVTFGDAV